MFHDLRLFRQRRSNTHKALKLGVVSVLIALLVILGFALQAPTPALASHYRASQLTWVKTGTPLTATFSLSASYRRSFFSPLPNVGDTIAPALIDYGDGTTDSPNLTVIAVDTVKDSITVSGSFNHTYSGNGPFTAAVSDCCRLDTSINNASGPIRDETIVSFPSVAGSPESTLPPL